MEHVIKFLKKAEELEMVHPFLYVEIARTRTTDYMAWLRMKPDGALIVSAQGLTADEACKEALEILEQDGKGQ
jgi:hypothetical protein